MQQSKDKRPSSHLNSLYLALATLLSLLAALVAAGLLVGQVRGDQSNVTLAVMVVGALALGVALTIVLIYEVRRQAQTGGQDDVELRRQNADLIRANNELQ